MLFCALFLCQLVLARNKPFGFVDIPVTLDASTAANCSTFDYRNIDLITFDVFAALMDTGTSLADNIKTALPQLSSTQVKKFVSAWESGYVSGMDRLFNPSQTHGLEPFRWIIETSLVQIIQQMDLAPIIPINGMPLPEFHGEKRPLTILIPI